MPLEFETDTLPAARRPEPLPTDGPLYWRGGRPPRSVTGNDDTFVFSGSVGPDGDNRREDVIKAQILLGNSGHYRIAGNGVPTGWPGDELFRGIRAFQKEKGLLADGLLLPPGPQGVDENGVGETLNALHRDLRDKLAGYAAPTPQEVDAYYERQAHFTGAPDDNGEATPSSDILVYDENGQAAHPVGVKKAASVEPREIRSDLDLPQPQWRDGQQLAMASAPPAQPIQIAPPPVPTAGQSGASKPHSPYPHEHPDVKAAALQLEKIADAALGNAAANMKRWYENGQAFADGFKRRDLPLNEAELAAFTPLPGTEPTPPSRPTAKPTKPRPGHRRLCSRKPIRSCRAGPPRSRSYPSRS